MGFYYVMPFKFALWRVPYFFFFSIFLLSLIALLNVTYDFPTMAGFEPKLSSAHSKLSIFVVQER